MPNSQSIWFEQVDTAFLSYIQSAVHFQVKDASISVKALVRKPDEDFKEEQYPLMSIYNLSAHNDPIRRCNEPVIVSRDESTKTLILEECSKPFNLMYQLDFWSLLASDMNTMTMQWLAATNDYFNLSVKDASGNNASCFVRKTEDLKKNDLLKKTDRIFHSFLTYRISVSLDDRVQKTAKMVTSVVIQ